MKECPLSIGDTFSILTAGQQTKYLKVEYIEELLSSRDLLKDFGSLSASGTSNDNAITELEMPGTKSSDDFHEVFYGWMEILDSIEITIKQPSSQSRFMTKAGSIKLGQWSGEIPIVSYQDEVPYLSVTNINSITQLKNRVQFYGYRIVCSMLQNEAQAKSLSQKPLQKLVASGFSS